MRRSSWMWRSRQEVFWEAPARGFSIKLLQIKFANVRLSRPSFGAHTLGIRRPYVYHINILLCTFFHTEVLSWCCWWRRHSRSAGHAWCPRLPAGLLTEHDSLLALSTWPPSPSWKVLFSFTLFIILYSFLISRPTWQNFTIPSHLTYWSVSQFLQCFYRGLFEAGRWNNIFSFPWILFSLSIPIHREMAALSGENIALMFSPTFHVFNENNSKRNVSCNYIIHSLYPCSIKTREVLINPSPMPKRFPETGENPSFVSRSGNPFLP